MSFSLADTHLIANLLRDAAKSEILPHFRNLTDGAVRQKTSALDLVTDADEAAERVIASGLRAAFPQAVVVGEEACELDPTLLDRLADADLAVLVDPIDGTKNFAAGLPLFGVMAAVVVRGEIVAGIIYDPLGDDFAIAVRGEGAWMERKDGARTRLRVAPPEPLSDLQGCVSWHFMAEPQRSALPANFPKVAAVMGYRCAAHEYRMAAAGHCHFLLYAKLMPWDHAAGWLLHREAGGYSARLDGSPYSSTHRSGGILCAPDAQTWSRLREALLGPEGTAP
jgi:fructose-1,6-bisphosphatase/inositol monophosphatase family enzyme